LGAKQGLLFRSTTTFNVLNNPLLLKVTPAHREKNRKPLGYFMKF